jgi:uncharacterized membrane protein
MAIKPTPFTLHIISLVLMIVTLQLGFWLLGESTMLTVLAVIGSVTFGFAWKRTTDYWINKHD